MNESPEGLRQQADRLERQAKAARERADRDTQIHNLFAPGKVWLLAGVIVAIFLCVWGR